MVDRRYVLISFSREKQRSPEATVTGIAIGVCNRQVRQVLTDVSF